MKPYRNIVFYNAETHIKIAEVGNPCPDFKYVIYGKYVQFIVFNIYLEICTKTEYLVGFLNQ